MKLKTDKPIKWILVNGEVRISTCLYHRDLLHKNERYPDVKGGGILEILPETKTLRFYGKSDDFGQVKISDFHKAIDNKETREDIYHDASLIGMMIGYGSDFRADGFNIVFECAMTMK